MSSMAENVIYAVGGLYPGWSAAKSGSGLRPNLAPRISRIAVRGFRVGARERALLLLGATRTSCMRRHVIYGERTFSLFAGGHETDVTYVIYAGDVTYADGRRKLLTTEA